MGCYIKKYEELRKALNINDQFVIVKKGFSAFYAQPESGTDYGELLDSLGLEIALAYHVDEFNSVYKDIETQWSRNVIDNMNKSTWKRSPIELPKTYDLLQDAIEPLTKGSYYIVRNEDVEICNLQISRVSTSVTEELGLAFVCKHNFDARFKNTVKWNNCQIFIDGSPLEEIIGFQFTDKQKRALNLTPIDTISFDIDTTGINKALKDLEVSARKTAEKIAIDTKAYGYSVTNLGTLHGSVSVPSYGTVHSTGKEVDGLTVYRSKTDDKLKGAWVLGASDLEDVVNSVFKKTKLFKRLNDIRSSYLGKLDTDMNRIAMEFEIREIFDEIEHTTGDANSIAGEWCECESCPPIIVNIGAININSKEELDTDLAKGFCEKWAKIVRESWEKAYRENGIS